MKNVIKAMHGLLFFSQVNISNSNRFEKRYCVGEDLLCNAEHLNNIILFYSIIIIVLHGIVNLRALLYFMIDCLLLTNI